MDRSFLTKPAVIAASRQFVCIRLTTYENAAEAKYLESICPTGSGQLENTVFTILAPDGKRQLSRATRSAGQAFDDASDMAQTMNRIAAWYRPKTTDRVPELPTVASVRLAIDVAACDSQPLIVVYGKSAAARKEMVAKLRPLAWSDDFRGRFVYVVAADSKDLRKIAGARGEDGVLVVQPDRFGLKGTVLKTSPADASSDSLAKCLEEASARFSKRPESFHAHVHEGRIEGVFWNTVIPVTDPMERRARQETQAESGRP